MPVSEHSALAIGDEYTAQGVRVTNGSTVYERGSTMYDYDTLQISSELATDDTAADIWGNAEGKAYDAVSCSDCVMQFIPFPACDVTFGQFPSRSYRIMSVTAKLSVLARHRHRVGRFPAEDGLPEPLTARSLRADATATAA